MLTSLCIRPQEPLTETLFDATLTTSDLIQAQSWLTQHSVDIVCLQLAWPEPHWLAHLFSWPEFTSSPLPILILLPEQWRSRLTACFPAVSPSTDYVAYQDCALVLHTAGRTTNVVKWTAHSTAQLTPATTRYNEQQLEPLSLELTEIDTLLDYIFNKTNPGFSAITQHQFIDHLIDLIPDPIFIKNEQHRWVFLNQEFCRLLGHSKDELIGKSDYDYFPNAEVAVFWEQDDVVFDTEQLKENQELFTDRDGTTHTIFTRKYCYVQPDGQKLLIGTIKDITEQQQNQKLLKRQQDYLTAIFEVQWLMLRCRKASADYYPTVTQQLGYASGASRVYIFENYQNAQGQLWMSQAAEWRTANLSEDKNPAYQNLPYSDLGPEFGQTLARQEVVSSLVDDLPQPMRDYFRDQQVLAVLIQPITIQGEFFGFIGFDNCHEAVLWTQAEVYLLQTVATTIAITQERLQIQRQYRQIVETTHEAICLLDLNGEIEFVNSQMSRLLDPHYNLTTTKSKPSLQGTRFIDNVSISYRARIQPHLDRDLHPDLDQTQPIHFNCPLQRINGSIVWTAVVANPRQDNGQHIGTLLMLTDISEGYNAKLALQQRLEVEQIVTSLSTQFMNVHSQDLDACIEQALQQIGEVIGVDRSYMFCTSVDRQTVSNTHEWCAPGVVSTMAQRQKLPITVYPWSIPKLQKGEMVYVPSVQELPPEASNEQKNFENQGICALMLVPMILRGEFLGFIGVDAVQSSQILVKTSLNLLFLVAEIFAGALERRRSENELQARLQLEQTIATISTQFIQLPTTEISEGIRVALEQVGQFSGSDCTYVYQLTETKIGIQKLHEWKGAGFHTGMTPHCEYFALETMPWLAGQLNQQKIIHFPSLDLIPAEAQSEREYLNTLGIQSLLIVPMVSQGELLGFVGFDGVQRSQTWSDSMITLLGLVGEMFANALHRSKIESEIQESQERFQQLADNINSVFWLTDPQTDSLLYVSSAYEEIFGQPPAPCAQNPGTFGATIVHPEDHTQYMAALPKQVLGDFDEEFRIIRPDGSTRWLSDRAFPILDDQGQVYRIAGITEDITERKINEQLKDEFISTLSHELRTPLTSLIVALKLLQKNPDFSENIQFKKLVTIAVNNSARLNSLIQNLLDVQNLAAQEYRFNDCFCTVQSLIAQVNDTCKPSEHLFQIERLSTALETVGCQVDPSAIMKVFGHLLDNSIKFSKAGSLIQLRSCRQAQEMRFCIEDQGIGITPENLQQIFRLFWQVDSSDTRRYGGVGLGLHICRYIVEHYGGRIWAESTFGIGSRFYFTLPIAPSA